MTRLDSEATEERARNIRALREQGFTYQEIADQVGVGRKTVKYWCNAAFKTRRAEERAAWYAKVRGAREEVLSCRRSERAAAKAERERLRAAGRERVALQKEENRRRSLVLARLRASRDGAGMRGLPFDLTENDVAELLQSGVCARTGLPFDKKGDFGVSLDRVDNSLGYTRDNVQAVCWAYNRAKGASTDAAVLQMAVALVNKTLVDRNCTLQELTNSVNVVEWG